MIEQACAARNDEPRVGVCAMNLRESLKNAGRVLARLDAAYREKHGSRSETETLGKLRFGSVGMWGIAACVHTVAAHFGFAAEALDEVSAPERAHDHQGVRCEDRSGLPPTRRGSAKSSM